MHDADPVKPQNIVYLADRRTGSPGGGEVVSRGQEVGGVEADREAIWLRDQFDDGGEVLEAVTQRGALPAVDSRQVIVRESGRRA